MKTNTTPSPVSTSMPAVVSGFTLGLDLGDPAHEGCWSVKVRAEHGCDSEKPALGVEKWLEMPREERIITKMSGKAQFKS